HVVKWSDHFHSAIGKTAIGIRDQEFGIEIMLDAEAVAVEAHSLRTVETEELGTGRLVAFATMCASVVSGEQKSLRDARFLRSLFRSAFRCFVVFHRDDQIAFAKGKSLFDGFGKARPELWIDLEAVDYNFNVVFDLPV